MSVPLAIDMDAVLNVASEMRSSTSGGGVLASLAHVDLGGGWLDIADIEITLVGLAARSAVEQIAQQLSHLAETIELFAMQAGAIDVQAASQMLSPPSPHGSHR